MLIPISVAGLARLDNRSHSLLFIALSAVVLACSSCSVVVGNVKPVDEKSDQYGIMNLSTFNPDWLKLNQGQSGARNPNATSTEVPDVAYQSKSTASIISLDSACRDAGTSGGENLETLTNLLFLGMTDVTLRTEKNLEIERSPALETTIQGKLSGENMAFKAVVLRHRNCIYDLVYMARPSHFPDREQDFSHFVASLRLK